MDQKDGTVVSGRRLFNSFFSLLLIATVIKELKTLDPVWKYCPFLLQFIPRWSFFAPIPSSHDYWLVYRTFSGEGLLGPWQDINEMKGRGFTSFIWNPEKRFSKGFLDILMDLLELSNKSEKKAQICISLPYLHILNYVDSLPHGIDVRQIQFMILRNSNVSGYEIVFRSLLHPIRDR